jgi:hypothetical protein
MKKDWAEPSHIGKICVRVIEVLSKEFNVEAKKPLEERDFDKLIRVGGAIGYQAMNYNSLQKSHETHQRIKNLEKQLIRVDMESIAMQESPVLFEESKLQAQAEFR